MKKKHGSLGSWFIAIRPKSLSAAVVPILVGTALSHQMYEKVRFELSLQALLCAFLIQIGTNFINDALDYKKGADTSERLGFTRVTQSGLLSLKQVWWAGIFAFLLSAVFSIPLVQAGGWPIIVIGIFSILFGYAYTGGPFPLAYLGLGDLFVLLFFGWIAVAGVFYLNCGAMPTASVIVAGTQVGLLAMLLLAINNLRDYKSDKKAHKKTLAVRFGPTFGRVEIILTCFLPFVLGMYWWFVDLYWAAILPWGICPLALTIVARTWNEPPSVRYNQYFAQAGALHLVFGILLAFGLILK